MWGDPSSGCDRNALWPGYRRFASDWLHGQRSFVLGAGVDGFRLLVGRAKFIGSSICPELWHYGYQRLNESVGFQSLPFVRVRLSANANKICEAGFPGTLKGRDVDDLLVIPKIVKFLGELTSPLMQAIVLEEFLSPRSIWSRDRRTIDLVEMSWGDRVIGFANCRYGNANVILDPQEVSREGPVLVRGVITILALSSAISQVCLFCPLPSSTRLSVMSEYLAYDRMYFFGAS